MIFALNLFFVFKNDFSGVDSQKWLVGVTQLFTE